MFQEAILSLVTEASVAPYGRAKEGLLHLSPDR